jgi:hypothetical protein
MLLRAQEGASSKRDVDLTAADGVKLKATYYAAAKPGREYCCCTSAISSEKIGMTWLPDLQRRESMY